MYAKPVNEDLVKMVVIQRPSTERKSLVKYLQSEKSTAFQPLHVANNVSFGSRFKVNAIECDEVRDIIHFTPFPTYNKSAADD